MPRYITVYDPQPGKENWVVWDTKSDTEVQRQPRGTLADLKASWLNRLDRAEKRGKESNDR